MRRFMLWPLVIMICFCLWFGSKIFVIKPGIIEEFVSYATYPILVVKKNIVAPLRYRYQQHLVMRNLFNAYEQIQVEQQKLLAENIVLQSVLATQSAAEELAEFKQRYNTNYMVLAQVIEKQFTQHEHFYYVDKGSKQGITQDMVMVHKNSLVGRVTEVYPYYCKVLLITDRACKVPAFCGGTAAQGIHQGANTKTTHLTFVSHLESIEVGDMVISKGEGLIFPRGFALGRIISAEKDGLHYRIEVKPLLDLSRIEYGYLLQKGAEPLYE